MGEKNKNQSFILQAGILAAAGILCRIIGILYRSPLTSIIGDEGNGYYSAAYSIYAIILLVSSYSIPSAISKVIAQRLALREYKNAHRIFHCALIYVTVVGGIASWFTYFGARFLVEEHSVIVLQVFAPTIFFSGLLGVLRGYFQSHKTMVQTSISQIIEQITNAVISILAAYLLMNSVQSSNKTEQAIHGAMGSAMGTGAGVLIALLFMIGMYLLNLNLIRKRIERDESKKLLSYRQIFGIIIFMVTPVLLSTFIYNFSTSLNYTIYTKILKNFEGYTASQIATSYGIFSGKAVVISNIPIAIASSISAAMIPNISGTYAQGDIKATHRVIERSIRITMLIAIPAAVGLFVLARPVVQLLFPQPSSIDLASSLLRGLCITVVFYSLSTLSNAILQGIGAVNKPVVNAAVSLVIQTIVLIGMLVVTEGNLYSLVIAAIVYSLFMCILNQFSIYRMLNYKNHYMKSFILPFIVSVVMGGVAFGTYHIVFLLVKSNVVSLGLSILVAMFVYFAGIIKIGVITETELRIMPKGHFMIALAKKLRLMK